MRGFKSMGQELNEYFEDLTADELDIPRKYFCILDSAEVEKKLHTCQSVEAARPFDNIKTNWNLKIYK